MVCLPALMRSGSTSLSSGNGPMPSMPFSLCSVIFMPAGMQLAMSVGSPMPRFTYWPSRSSCAARWRICSRVSISGARLARGALLDALLVALPLDEALHEDAGRVHVVGVQRAGGHDLLDLRDRDARGHGHHRVEVARGAAVDEVAGLVGPPRLHQRVITGDRGLEHVGAPVELARLL